MVFIHPLRASRSSPLSQGDKVGGESVPLYTQLVAVKVVAIAVRMVITTLRILPQRVLLLKVPILLEY